MKPDRIQQLLERGAARRVLVIGDIMLDEFVWGRVSRISPEAPVPVVEVVEETSYPGGAANVARNLAEFTSQVRVLGLIGPDPAGITLRSLLDHGGINSDCLIEQPDSRTIVKTRIIARQQQVVRVDRERALAVVGPAFDKLVTRVREVAPETDIIIFEDYGKGLITQAVKNAVCAIATEFAIPVCVDPNPGNPIDWSGVDVIKPNRSEAFAAAGVKLSEPDDDPLADKPLLETGRRLVEKWGASQLLVTLGEHGMILFADDAPPYHTPTRAREVFDVSGAGDTVIALYSLALASGASPQESAEIANHAAGVVVGKLGTATLTPAELINSFSND